MACLHALAGLAKVDATGLPVALLSAQCEPGFSACISIESKRMLLVKSPVAQLIAVHSRVCFSFPFSRLSAPRPCIQDTGLQETQTLLSYSVLSYIGSTEHGSHPTTCCLHTHVSAYRPIPACLRDLCASNCALSFVAGSSFLTDRLSAAACAAEPAGGAWCCGPPGPFPSCAALALLALPARHAATLRCAAWCAACSVVALSFTAACVVGTGFALPAPGCSAAGCNINACWSPPPSAPCPL